MSNDETEIEQSGLFDREWYIAQYPDVGMSGINPAKHYLAYGVKLSRNPGPLFDAQAYFDRNADVSRAGVNPLLHYIRYGKAEGRKAIPVGGDRASRTQGATANKIGRVAVVFHAHHLELISDCLDYIKNIGDCDLFVTTSHSGESAAIKQIVEHHSNARIFTVANSGRDIGPFISIWNEIKNYDICCKLHTKKGTTKYAKTWREICFDSMFGSKKVVLDILDCFRREPELAILGPECMYKSGAKMIGANGEGVRKLEAMIGADRSPIDSPEWGFFAGSVFWFRPQLMERLGRLQGLDFGQENGLEDGGVAHAVERFFGSRILAPKSKIGFARRNPDGQVSIHSENSPGTPDEEPYVATLEKYANAISNPNSVIGYLDVTEIGGAALRGWLAVRGDARPRRAVLQFDGKRSFYVVANKLRSDLAAKGINRGQHAFDFEVPADLKDGLYHEVELIDALIGRRIATQRFCWAPALPDLFHLTSHVPQVETVVVFTGNLGRDVNHILNDLNRLGERFDLVLSETSGLSLAVDAKACNDVFRVPTSAVVSSSIFLHLVNSGFLCKYRNICWVDFGAFPTEAVSVSHEDAWLVHGDVAVAATTVVRQDVATWSPQRRAFVASALEQIQRSQDDVGEVSVGRGVLWVAPLLLWQLRACRIDPLTLIDQPDSSAMISGLLSLFARSGDMTVEPVDAARRSARRRDRPPGTDRSLSAIAFLLPQFHPIVENDRWWSTGFTEWANVVRGRPLFKHHDQPKLPADLGFYDLRLPQTRQAQATLAKQYGVFGFCYYYYWFDGKKLLNQPIEEMLASQEPDMPFCVCWANENWTRSWDGQNRFVLIEQNYSSSALAKLIDEFIGMMRDPRYIRHNGKPVLLVYRIRHIPNWIEIAEMWRQACRDAGVGEIHLCAVRFGAEPLNGSTVDFGVDSFVMFPPHECKFEDARAKAKDLAPDFTGQILDYDAAVEGDLSRFAEGAPWPVHRGAMLSWDNTARRDREARIFLGATPLRFRAWLRGIAQQVGVGGKEEEMIFLVAWNEWAEGTTLEPNQRFGLGYLEALRTVIGDRPLAQETRPPLEDRRQPPRPNFRDMIYYDGARADNSALPTVLLCAHLAGKEIFGAERSFIDMLDGLRTLPVNIVVTLPSYPPYLRREGRSENTSEIGAEYLAEVQARSSAVWAFPYSWFSNRPIDEDCVLRFSEIIAWHGVSVVHANTIMLWEPLIAARRLGRKSVIHARELVDHDEALSGFIGLSAAEIKQTVIANSDFLIANSRETARVFSHPKTFYVPNAVDISELDMKNELGQRIRFGLVSSNIPKKGIYDFLECAKICHKTAPKAEFVVIGPENELVVSLKEALENGELPNNVIFTGYKKTPREAMEEINVLVNLSHFAESFGRTVAEAMAARRAVIAYDWGALPELVQDGGNGFLVPYRDVEALAERVRLLCESPSEIERVGKNGRTSVCKNFSQLSLMTQMIGAYDSILAYEPPYDRPLPLTVIVPIYNAPSELEICLASLAENIHPFEARVFLVDDGSPDPRIGDILNVYSKDERFRVIRNIDNIGYTKTINKAMRYAPDSDIILLNSDTIVTPGWIAGLRSVAYSRRRVGTVTAMSDNAGAFSFPNHGRDNAKPDYMSYNDYARRMIAHTAPVPPVEVPTGSGFCMYIRGALIDEIGLFDDEAFPKGYGEENDYCMRALNAGWLNLISPCAFIYHRKSASFGSARSELVRQGMVALDRLHPTFEQRVKAAFSSESMAKLRGAATAAAAALKG